MKSDIDDITDDTLLTTQDVADLLQCTAPSVINWANAGKLPVLRTDGGHRRIRVGDVIGFLRRTGREVPQELLPARRRLLFVTEDRKLLRSLERWFRKNATKVLIENSGTTPQALMQAVLFRPHLVLAHAASAAFDVALLCDNLQQHPLTTNARVALCAPVLSKRLAAGAAAHRAVTFRLPLDHRAVADLVTMP